VGGCAAGLPLLVTGFNLEVTMVARSVINPNFVRTESMNWRMPITTYPLATPFLVTQNPAGTTAGTALKGAGAILSSQSACEGDQNSSGMIFDLAWIDKLL
jgi:hypothetical protein